jgi:hypothetical protein
MFSRMFLPRYPLTPLGLIVRSLCGGFGGLFTLAGVIVLAHSVAPHAVERVIPDWSATYAPLALVAVGLGALRAVCRLIVPICSLLFWGLVISAVVYSSGAWASVSGTHSIAVPQQPARNAVSLPMKPIALHGTPSLPDSAYFPTGGGGLSALKRLPIVGGILRAVAAH